MKPPGRRAKYRDIPRGELESSLPLFLNGRLDAERRHILEEWLQSDDQAMQELESWREIHAAVTGCAHGEPSQRVWVELVERIDRDLQKASLPRRVGISFVSLLTGFALAIVSLLLLWIAIRPGVLLHWTISEPAPVSYRIYRAPANSDEFVLVKEVHGKPGVRDYSYLDSLFVPGSAYIYRIEGVNPANVPLFSQAVHSSTSGALPGQVAILIASILVGLLAAGLVQQRTGGSYLSLWPSVKSFF
jgi:hypothetical protein